MIKIMISHAQEDDLLVDYLFGKLDRENLGLDIFVDHKQNLIGDDAQVMIDEAKKSIIFIPVFSNTAVKKDFIIKETKTVLDSPSTYIFPIKSKCDEDKIPSEIKIAFKSHDRVSGILYEDFSKIDEWKIKYEKLLKAIISKLTELDMYQKDEFFYQDAEIIDKILSRDNPSPAEIKIMVDVYLKKEAYQYYFFNRLKNLNWLNFLKIYRFFDKNPKPIQVENQTGSYRIPRWSVLNYLEWGSTQIDEDKDPKFGEYLIEIVRSVSNNKDENGARIDNHITDWVLIKIMANLPDRFVKVIDIEMIRDFLKSRWDITLISSEVGINLLPKLLNHHQKEKALKGEEMTGTDAEACAYLYTAALTQPMGHDWGQIYLYIAGKTYTRWKKNEMPEDIRVETLRDDQMADLNRLKEWLYRKRSQIRLERERAERRQRREEEATKRKREQPALFDF